MSFKCAEQLKLDDRFIEEGQYGGVDVCYVVTKAPVITTTTIEGHEYRQCCWEGQDDEGEFVEFLITEGLSHYGPRIRLL